MKRVVLIYPSGCVFTCMMDDDTIIKSKILTSVGTVFIDHVIAHRSGYVYQDWVNRVECLFDMLEYPVCDTRDMQQAKKHIINDL